jgi:ParB/RepB/Spo0J family partition protein
MRRPVRIAGFRLTALIVCGTIAEADLSASRITNQKANAMELKRVELSKLKGAKYNPKSRTAKGSKTLAQLKASIEKIGLIYPIAVDREMKVIDGHRRIAAVKELGWESVPVIVVTSDDTDAVYADVNANLEKLTGNDNLQVWLKRPSAVTSKRRARYEALQAAFGREMLIEAATIGQSGRVFAIATQVARYCGMQHNPAFTKKSASWLMKWMNQSLVAAYIRLQHPPRTLHAAVMKGRDLKAVYSIK